MLYSQSKTYQALLNAAITAGKYAVSAAYINACIEQNTLVDPTEYLLKAPKAPKSTKRKRTARANSSSEDEESKTKRLEYYAKYNAKRKAVRDEARMLKESPAKAATPDYSQQLNSKNSPATSSHRLKATSPEIIREGLRSPTPPPYSAHEISFNGKYKYSELERDYVKRYTKILFERDHQMSLNEVANALNKKVGIDNMSPAFSVSNHWIIRCHITHYCPGEHLQSERNVTCLMN